MIVKGFKQGNTEIMVTATEKHKYSAIKLIEGAEPQFMFNMDYEDSTDIFDYWLDDLQGIERNIE